MFQYLRGSDRLLLIIGTILRKIGEFSIHSFVFLFGRLSDSFNPYKEETIL